MTKYGIQHNKVNNHYRIVTKNACGDDEIPWRQATVYTMEFYEHPHAISSGLKYMENDFSTRADALNIIRVMQQYDKEMAGWRKAETEEIA